MEEISNKTKSINVPFNPIDFLRLCAMLFVVVLHLVSMLDTESNSSVVSFLGIFSYFPAWSGVWIFFFISSYLNIRSFAGGRYDISGGGILKFYKNRFLKLIPTYIIWIVILGALYPEAFFGSPVAIVELFTFTFKGTSGGVTYLGETWFISTIVQFYLLCPLLFVVLDRLLRNKKRAIVAFGLVASIGLLTRILLISFDIVSWYEYIYTPIYGNLDILICGGILAFGAGGVGFDFSKVCRISSLILFVLLFIFNCWCYYSGLLKLYEAFFPTLWIIISSFVILTFRNCSGKSPWIVKQVCSVSFEVYMVHPLVGAILFSNFSNLSGVVGTFVVLLAMVFSVLAAYLLEFLVFYVRVILSYHKFFSGVPKRSS